MELGNSKHAGHRDTELARETREYVEAGHSSRAEPWRETEPADGSGPEAELLPTAEGVGGTPPGMDGDDVAGRSDLARLLDPGEFPADAKRLAATAARHQADDATVAALRALPADRRYRTVSEVWAALGHRTEDDTRRF
ncbi:DUF2795 domain-containing protein [Actinocatenispora comari]|jgi:hypothetical protein|uniref:DUF2795 domain-containing protein n=1 Tax=Actinocatenispora comari TaxID=2807577 RepID=A0A8J4AHZ0_9ACTN|nr:DUF2795 domain-containing protein [Actinocatenispora comari]GIL29885.1 hypothetical protein NUM_51390 [Actinocatenispora comari]